MASIITDTLTQSEEEFLTYETRCFSGGHSHDWAPEDDIMADSLREGSSQSPSRIQGINSTLLFDELDDVLSPHIAKVPSAAESDSVLVAGRFLPSLRALHGVEGSPSRIARIRSLSVLMGQLRSLDGLQQYHALTSLDLTGNLLTSAHFTPSRVAGCPSVTGPIPVLAYLPQLRALNLSGNRLHTLPGLQYLSQLETLSLSGNKIAELGFLADLLAASSTARPGGAGSIRSNSTSIRQRNTAANLLHEGKPPLRWLDLALNLIADRETLRYLSSFTLLEELRLYSPAAGPHSGSNGGAGGTAIMSNNPICGLCDSNSLIKYRAVLLELCPWLKMLDGVAVGFTPPPALPISAPSPLATPSHQRPGKAGAKCLNGESSRRSPQNQRRLPAGPPSAPTQRRVKDTQAYTCEARGNKQNNLEGCGRCFGKGSYSPFAANPSEDSANDCNYDRESNGNNKSCRTPRRGSECQGSKNDNEGLNCDSKSDPGGQHSPAPVVQPIAGLSPVPTTSFDGSSIDPQSGNSNPLFAELQSLKQELSGLKELTAARDSEWEDRYKALIQQHDKDKARIVELTQMYQAQMQGKDNRIIELEQQLEREHSRAEHFRQEMTERAGLEHQSVIARRAVHEAEVRTLRAELAAAAARAQALAEEKQADRRRTKEKLLQLQNDALAERTTAAESERRVRTLEKKAAEAEAIRKTAEQQSLKALDAMRQQHIAALQFLQRCGADVVELVEGEARGRAILQQQWWRGCTELLRAALLGPITEQWVAWSQLRRPIPTVTRSCMTDPPGGHRSGGAQTDITLPQCPMLQDLVDLCQRIAPGRWRVVEAADWERLNEVHDQNRSSSVFKESQCVGVQTGLCGLAGLSPNDPADLVSRRHLRELAARCEILEQQNDAAFKPLQQLAEAVTLQASLSEQLRAAEATIASLRAEATAATEAHNRTVANLRDSLGRKDQQLSDIEAEAKEKIQEKRDRIAELEEALEATEQRAQNAEAATARAREEAAAQASLISAERDHALQAAAAEARMATETKQEEINAAVARAIDETRASLLPLIASLRSQLAAEAEQRRIEYEKRKTLEKAAAELDAKCRFLIQHQLALRTALDAGIPALSQGPMIGFSYGSASGNDSGTFSKVPPAQHSGTPSTIKDLTSIMTNNENMTSHQIMHHATKPFGH